MTCNICFYGEIRQVSVCFFFFFKKKKNVLFVCFFLKKKKSLIRDYMYGNSLIIQCLSFYKSDR